jgi:ring-1,2-phenylacetyl-CoA epoxidase subunit PaaC
VSAEAELLAPILLALGDDELILGHRHSEWTGYAPHIEEDVAFSSIAQDEIGHAAAYYSIAAQILGGNADELAFGRQPGEYRHALLCERPNNEWAYTLARHWLYDTADDLRLETLAGSSNRELAGLATKIRREERYHLLHAGMWMRRVAHGPVEGRSKLVHALTDALPDALGVFEPFEGENDAVKEGLLTTPSGELRERFLTKTAAALDDFGLPSGIAPLPGDQDDAEFVASSSGDLIESDSPPAAEVDARGDGLGGRTGRHTQDFTAIWEVMTSTYRGHPGARW